MSRDPPRADDTRIRQGHRDPGCDGTSSVIDCSDELRGSDQGSSTGSWVLIATMGEDARERSKNEMDQSLRKVRGE